MRHYGSDLYEVVSGGNEPTRVNAIAVRVMREIGIDISWHKAKGIAGFLGQHFDVVITVCDQANEMCPVFPGAGRRFHWSFQDPPQTEEDAPEILEGFRRVRDEIHARFRQAAEEGFAAFPANQVLTGSGQDSRAVEGS